MAIPVGIEKQGYAIISAYLLGYPHVCRMNQITNVQHSEMLVNVDRDRILQVLTNLLSNAIKFSAKNENILIKISAHYETIRVSISNKGERIPKEFQSRLF